MMPNYYPAQHCDSAMTMNANYDAVTKNANDGEVNANENAGGNEMNEANGNESENDYDGEANENENENESENETGGDPLPTKNEAALAYEERGCPTRQAPGYRDCSDSTHSRTIEPCPSC